MSESTKSLEDSSTSILIDNDCIFCLDDTNEIIKFKCCNTYYHNTCLGKYIEYNEDSILLCPSCRQPISDKRHSNKKWRGNIIIYNVLGSIIGCILIIFALILLKKIE